MSIGISGRDGHSSADRLGPLAGFAHRFNAYCARADDDTLRNVHGALRFCNRGVVRFLASGFGSKESPNEPDRPASELRRLVDKGAGFTLTAEMHVALLRAKGPLEGAVSALERGDVSTAQACITLALGRADPKVESVVGVEIGHVGRLLGQEPPDITGANRAIRELLEP